MSYNPIDNLPWSPITNHINTKYNVLGTFSLDDYFYRMNELYVKLAPFKSRNFLPNEKIVLYFFDTEFILNRTGFTIYNLQQIISKLNISQSAFLFLTSHYGIEHEIWRLGCTICNDDWPMTVMPSSYVQTLSNPYPPESCNASKNVVYPFIFLNGAQRSHRLMFLCYLEHHQLLDKGVVTWNFENNLRTRVPVTRKEKLPAAPGGCTFLSTTPVNRFNNQVAWNYHLRDLYSQYHSKFYNRTGCSNQGSSQYTGVGSCGVEDHFNKAFLYVIGETVFDYPYRFITEKTFKAFLNQRPFVIIGPPGTLAELKRLGFKTFDGIFDESYDTIADPSERLLKVGDIVKRISQYTLSELNSLLQSIEPILSFNYNHYKNHYCQTELKRFIDAL